MKEEIKLLAKTCKESGFYLGELSSEKKNDLLLLIAEKLVAQKSEIITANEKDLKLGKEAGMSDALLDRLLIGEKRIEAIAQGVREVVDLHDPIGEVLEEITLENGVLIKKQRVPLGCIGIIYEARPNVTVDAAALCLKTSNSVLLRGSKSAYHSNTILVEIMQSALEAFAIPREAVSLVPYTERESVMHMLGLRECLDVIIPRGGAALINFVVEHAKVPVLETGAGNCHMYIDKAAPEQLAAALVINAKTQRPSVCNAIETLLVHKDWAQQHLSELCSKLEAKGVDVRREATEEDLHTEFLDLILAVKIVEDVKEAVAHINRYGTKHSECIVSNDASSVSYFQQHVDAAAVYHNVSTRFTDGFEFGFGAEIGISTQKLHARGPMGLRELTSYKYLLSGSGQIRN